MCEKRQKKRPLFVFAGQSNMMGAAVYPPTEKLDIGDSYEYKHKPRRFGAKHGDFTLANFDCGEFSYYDLSAAYPDGKEGKSTLNHYWNNTYFCPAMCNLRSDEEKSVTPFVDFSESDYVPGPSTPPYFAAEWEKLGNKCAYIHVAKGAAPITHFLIDHDPSDPKAFAAADYFRAKVRDFFADASEKFKDEDTSDRVFVWLQGESDVSLSRESYESKLCELYDEVFALGCNYFFIIRVGYWGDERIRNIIRAQEDFCRTRENAYIITRACSFMPFFGQDESKWFISPPSEEYRECRDSFFGFPNQHVNAKGHALIAKRLAQNAERVLNENLPPEIEEENVKGI